MPEPTPLPRRGPRPTARRSVPWAELPPPTRGLITVVVLAVAIVTLVAAVAVSYWLLDLSGLL